MALPGREIVIAGLLTLAGLTVLIGLGVWQLERLQWKQNLISMVQSRSEAPATDVPPPAEWQGLESEDYEYRAVRLSGTFLHDHEAHVYGALSEPRGRFGGPGWWVMTPMELTSGGIVIINRGFVPEARKDPATREEGQVEGPVRIEGLMRAPEAQGPFVPDDDPARNMWFTKDPARIAAAHRLEGPVAPFFVDARGLAPGGLPQGGETRLVFRNDHLGYAITWFGLAAALAGVFAFWARARLVATRQAD